MNIEDKIRKIQADIMEIKKNKKGMIPDIKIITYLLSEEWKQDHIEKIRDEK